MAMMRSRAQDRGKSGGHRMSSRRRVPPNGTILPPPAVEGPLILFDGVCVMCSGFVTFVIRRDPRARFRFVAAQTPLGQSLLSRLGLSTVDFESNVLIEDGRAWFKSGASFAILRRLPWPWPWLTVLRFLPLALTDRVYDLVADNRYRLFGKREACLVPTPDIRRRFVE
jgi:predicted DCC family thiol-disulfide oxidoreductase YuxK